MAAEIMFDKVDLVTFVVGLVVFIGGSFGAWLFVRWFEKSDHLESLKRDIARIERETDFDDLGESEQAKGTIQRRWYS